MDEYRIIVFIHIFIFNEMFEQLSSILLIYIYYTLLSFCILLYGFYTEKTIARVNYLL